MDLSKLIATALLSSGLVHPHGHVQSGNESGVPTTIDYKNMVENRDGKFKNVSDETDWNGSGFTAQDKFKRALDSPEADLATGLYKLLYPITQSKVAPTGVSGGDIGEMRRLSGNKYVKESLALSALWDLLKSTKAGREKLKNKDLSFTTIDGNPGLTATWRF